MLKIIDKKLLYKGEFCKLWGKTFLDKKGKELVWECLEKKDAAIVFPITKEGKIVLIKSYRIPVEKYVIELPAGLMDKEGESGAECVRRELLDETGYEAEEIIPVQKFAYSPGTLGTIVHTFIARGCRKISDNHGDDCEDISTFEIEPTELISYALNLQDDMLFSVSALSLYAVAKEKKYIN